MYVNHVGCRPHVLHGMNHSCCKFDWHLEDTSLTTVTVMFAAKESASCTTFASPVI